MDARDAARRQADLDWLYGTNDPVDRTRVLDESEQAELERRRQRLAGDEPAPRTPPVETTPAARERVVHREDDLGLSGASAAPRPRTEPVPAPRPPQPAPRPTQSAVRAPKPRKAPQPVGAVRAPKPPRPHRRFPWLRILLTLLAAWLVWLLVVPLVATSRMNSVKEQPAGERPGRQPGTATLLVGSDARENLTKEQQAKLGTGTEVGKRTDTMMLLYQPDNGRPVLVSLPRDSYVPIPGHNKNKLNAAYALGGPELLVRTVEQNTGLRIDHYMEIGFDGFANVIDALGGIQMCPKQAIDDKDSHLHLKAGCQDLDGTTALGYVRMRKADPTGDLGRMKRQREMVSAVTKKAVSPWTFINPVRYWKLNMAVGAAISHGQDTGATDLVGALNSMRSISSGKGLTLAVPIADANASTAAGSSVIWDEAKAADMFGQMARGNTDGLDKYAK